MKPQSGIKGPHGKQLILLERETGDMRLRRPEFLRCLRDEGLRIWSSLLRVILPRRRVKGREGKKHGEGD